MLGFKTIDKATHQSKLVESTLIRGLKENEELNKDKDLKELETETLDECYSEMVKVLKETLSVNLNVDENLSKSIEDKYKQATEIGTKMITLVKRYADEYIKPAHEKVLTWEKDEEIVNTLTKFYNTLKLDCTEDEREQKLLPFGYIDKGDLFDRVELDAVKVLYNSLNAPYNQNGEKRVLDISIFAGSYLKEDSLNILRNISSLILRNFPEFIEFDENNNPKSDDTTVAIKCAKDLIEDVEDLNEFVSSCFGKYDLDLMDNYLTVATTVEEILSALLKFKEDYESGEFMKKFPEAKADNINSALAIVILLLERFCFLHTLVFGTCLSFIKDRNEQVELIIKGDK